MKMFSLRDFGSVKRRPDIIQYHVISCYPDIFQVSPSDSIIDVEFPKKKFLLKWFFAIKPVKHNFLGIFLCCLPAIHEKVEVVCKRLNECEQTFKIDLPDLSIFTVCQWVKSILKIKKMFVYIHSTLHARSTFSCIVGIFNFIVVISKNCPCSLCSPACIIFLNRFLLICVRKSIKNIIGSFSIAFLLKTSNICQKNISDIPFSV